MTKPTCPICKGKEWDTGMVETGGWPHTGMDSSVYYKSFDKKFIAPPSRLEADVCLNCGHVIIYVNTKDLKKRLKR
jgi:hypothetical protein